MGINVLVTGAGGYIGSELVQDLIKNGYKVVALDRFFFGNTLSGLTGPNIKIVKEDTRSFDPALLKGIDVVIDLAGLSSYSSSELDYSLTKSINTYGSIRVAKLAKKARVKRLIYSSSASVYGASHYVLNERSATKPVSVYGKSKLAAEKAILNLSSRNFSVTSLRNSTVYGLSRRRMRFDLMVNTMTLRAYNTNTILVTGGGTQWRPLVHIKDVIQAFMLVVAQNGTDRINGEIFNVGSNDQNYQVIQVANMFKPLFPGLILDETQDEPDSSNYRVNFDKITKTLNFKSFFQIAEGILEIKSALKRGEISDGINSNTGKYYKYLIDADRILNSVKLNNKLFEL